MGSFETEEATRETREETYGTVTKTKGSSGVIAKERIRTCVVRHRIWYMEFFLVGGPGEEECLQENSSEARMHGDKRLNGLG